MKPFRILAATFAISLAASAKLSAETDPPYDIVVYGDASGGVTAAVQAARMGKKVVLVSQYGHLGGLTSSGLGWSDIGNNAILGGLSREFYHRLYRHYQNDKAWTHEARADYGNAGQGVPALDPKTELASTFEPKVAEAVFDAMIEDSGVRVIQGRLDLKQGVIKDGKRIAVIRLVDGTMIGGRMFIDASYEGDLLPGAGVSFVTGREANSEFDEKGNGITGPLPKNQLPKGIDPYIIPGDSASGLLPGVNPDMGGEVGDADDRLQAYCYRMVLTDVGSNRVPVPKPDNYDEKDYEILFRAIEAGQKGGFFKFSMMPNRKTDTNNNFAISTDFIGQNWDFPGGLRDS